MNNIIEHNKGILNNIIKSFINPVAELGADVLEVYSPESLNDYKNDMKKALDSRQISLQEFEKGMKDLSRLAMRKITDKNGHQRIVYVKVEVDEKGNSKDEKDFEQGHSVKFTKDGKEHVGKIHSLKFHDKTDKVGTAIVDVDGTKHSVSLAKLKHSNNNSDDEKIKQSSLKPLMSALQTSNSKYNDSSKVTVEATTKGNWRIYYDNKDTGITLNGNLLSDDNIEKYDLRHFNDDSLDTENEITGKEAIQTSIDAHKKEEDEKQQRSKPIGKTTYGKIVEPSYDETDHTGWQINDYEEAAKMHDNLSNKHWRKRKDSLKDLTLMKHHSDMEILYRDKAYGTNHSGKNPNNEIPGKNATERAKQEVSNRMSDKPIKTDVNVDEKDDRKELKAPMRGINKKGLPSNIADFLKRNGENETEAKQANSWLHSLTGRNFLGGTAIGKHYDTLVLDISYQGSEVYVRYGEIKINNTVVSSKKEFETELRKLFKFGKELEKAIENDNNIEKSFEKLGVL